LRCGARRTHFLEDPDERQASTRSPLSFRTSTRSSSSIQIPSFNMGLTERSYSYAVSFERRTLWAAFRDIFSSRQIALIALP
jgi:hypothetical protein